MVKPLKNIFELAQQWLCQRFNNIQLFEIIEFYRNDGDKICHICQKFIHFPYTQNADSMQKKTPAKPSKDVSHKTLPMCPSHYAAHWPIDLLPLAMFGINGNKTVAASALQVLKPADFFAKRWTDLAEQDTTKPIVPRWIGVISYDEFCAFAHRKQPSLIYEIHEALIWNNGVGQPDRVVCGDPKSCALKLDAAALRDIEKEIAKSALPATTGNRLLPNMSDETYLSQVHDVLAAIRKGHFYQLNLLRYFRLEKSWKWPQVCLRVNDHGGPMSALFRHGNTAVASFSPERFISIEANSGAPQIHTWPIKGTAPRHQNDPKKDHQAKVQLLESEKDLAELHMIVDLMRNDLQQVCLPKTVEVPVKQELKTFQHVHHLQSHVSGQLRPDITMGDVMSALAPGGSITGAPKLEVMKTIHGLEGRDRGFIMGNAFVMYSDGSFESNILIRTLVSSDGAKTWEYAAGSGLVIKSDPHQELLEIAAKCRPVTD